MTLLEEMDRSDLTYKPTVVRDMIKSNREQFGFVKRSTKKIIFFMTKRAALRGAAKYLKIQDNRNNDEFLTMEDIVVDIYIVLDRCVDKYDVNSQKDFYLYYNKAINNFVNRKAGYKRFKEPHISFQMFETTDKEGDSMNVAESLAAVNMERAEEYVVEEMLRYTNLNDKERDLIVTITQTEKTTDIMSDLNISLDEYKDTLQSIRNKISLSEVIEKIKLRNI